MPSSDYDGFYVMKRDENGVLEAMPGVDVVIYSDELASDIATETTDGDGYISPGTASGVNAGTRLRFRVENEDGLAGSVTQITT